MWFMPSYGRPQRLRELQDAIGGWPERVIVLVNEDDPELDGYTKVKVSKLAPWRIHFIPAGSRCADAHRYISQKWPNEPFYGLLTDDLWPMSPGWHEDLVKAAEDRFISVPAGEPAFPKIRNACVIGGRLARAWGSLVPPPVKHNYEDNFWDKVAEDFKLLRPVPQHFVEHRHWIRGDAEKDKTYERGSADIDQDKEIYEKWLAGPERNEVWKRISELTGVKLLQFDPSKINLVILMPLRTDLLDVSVWLRLQETQQILNNSGIKTGLYVTTGNSHVGIGRESLLWNAWYDRKPTHIMWIDSDMLWDPQEIGRLIACDHAFSGVAGRKKKEDVEFCFRYPSPIDVHPVTGFIRAHDVGMAFILMKAEVITTLCEKYPELRWEGKDGRDEWALFLDMIHCGERLSEDLAFCARWTEIGGEIWVDPYSDLGHIGKKIYSGKMADFIETEQEQECPPLKSA